MLAIVATIVAATAAGVAAERRFGERGCAVARRALSFVLYVLLPPIIFFNLARARIDTDAGVGLLFGLGATALTAALAWLVCARVLRCSRPVTGAVMVCALIGNTGYLGYPVTAALLGFDELGRAVPYDVLVSGSDTLIGGFSVGAAFGATAGHGVQSRHDTRYVAASRHGRRGLSAPSTQRTLMVTVEPRGAFSPASGDCPYTLLPNSPKV